MEKYERLRELGRGSYGCAVLVRDRNSRQQRLDLSVRTPVIQVQPKCGSTSQKGGLFFE